MSGVFGEPRWAGKLYLKYIYVALSPYYPVNRNWVLVKVPRPFVRFRKMFS